MRMSCNGCRVLRKGCIENCTLRPCLEWIESPESQANATLFLAKFYGRAGLINLIKSGPSHLRPEIFRSLLYEACGRIISPVHGSVGLMCSGDWPRCQAAVEAVLRGAPLMNEDDSASGSVMPLQGCDIRHLSKDSAAACHRRGRARNRSKRSAETHANSFAAELMSESEAKFTITGWDDSGEDRKGFSEELKRARSHDSYSVETVEPALVNRSHAIKPELELGEIALELTLGGPNSVFGVIEISDTEN
ncbi:LOB domain-containing protein 40-like [Salvia miltiorrhiza]|uniref:LOB domain-containing protein 40-like n=1 Tax=Salvia miltiorrhiza TaxID=226208 RepID=UPI0025ACE91B|nr:LOB domain-containing protein 40-like [Salvia miltiorrhiza]